jgi:hypothetical protein
MTTARYAELKRKLKLVVLATLTIAFVIATIVGLWQLAVHYLNNF